MLRCQSRSLLMTHPPPACCLSRSLQLVHLMFDPPGNGPCGLWSGGHLFSRDGTRWSPIYRAYNTTVALEGGGSVTFQRRERPKLIFDAAGTPTHLYNGAISDSNGVYTIVAPLKV